MGLLQVPESRRSRECTPTGPHLGFSRSQEERAGTLLWGLGGMLPTPARDRDYGEERRNHGNDVTQTTPE